MVLKGRFGLHKKEVVIVSCDGFLKLIICSLRKLVKLWQFQLCKAAEERRMGRNNAVLKNYQSALKKGKSNLHTLEEKYFKKINVLCGRGIGFILVHCGNCNFYECCRGRQTLSQGREGEARSQRRTRSFSSKLLQPSTFKCSQNISNQLDFE